MTASKSRWLPLLITFCLSASCVPHQAYSADRPNVVFFLVDDLGAMDIGVTNPDTFYETPNIDRLANSGMRFTNGYAANPVCSPTRFSILTGRYPTRRDCTNFFSGKRPGKFKPAPLNDRMPLDEVTLAETLKDNGYATFFAGKWHLGPNKDFWPKAQGFDVNKGGHERGGPYGGKKYFSPYGNPRLEDGPDGEHLPDRLASEAAQFIADHKEQPFLTYIAFYSVHTPLIGRPDLVKKYEAKAKRLGLPVGRDLSDDRQFADEEQHLPVKQPRRVRTVQSHAVYAAMVEAMDLAVGKVLDALEENGVANNTIVCLTSDNGGLSTSEGWPTSNLPLRGGKGWLYEGGIREAFMIRAPGVTEPGTISDAPVISIDFLPTILDLTNAKRDSEHAIDGVSLVPLLKQSGKSPERSLYWHYPHYSNQGGFPGGAIRAGDWKLIEDYEEGQVRLYHLKEDVGEQTNLADSEPDRVQSMRADLHLWYQDVDAKFLQPNEPNGPKPWQPQK